MPLLKPNPVINEILQETGLTKVTSKNGNGKFTKILDEHGLSLEDTAERLRALAESSDEGIRFRANELIIKAHGALNETEKEVPTVTFVLQSDNVNLLQILTPRG